MIEIKLWIVSTILTFLACTTLFLFSFYLLYNCFYDFAATFNSFFCFFIDQWQGNPSLYGRGGIAILLSLKIFKLFSNSTKEFNIFLYNI